MFHIQEAAPPLENKAADTLVQLYSGELYSPPHCDILIRLASPQKFKMRHVLGRCQHHCPCRREQPRWPTIPPASAVLAISSNQCYQLPFPDMGKWTSPLEQSNPPSTLYPLATTCENTQTLDWRPKGGDVCGDDPPSLFSFFMSSWQNMCNGKCSTSQKGRRDTFPR